MEFKRSTVLGAEFERVRAVEVAPVRAEPGDRFEAVYGSYGIVPGTVLTVRSVDASDELGDRYLSQAHGRDELETFEALCDPSQYRPLPSASPRPVSPLVELDLPPTTEGPTSDLDGPAGEELPFADQREDRRLQAHMASLAGAASQVWAEDIRKLVDARERERKGGFLGLAAGVTVDVIVERMAARAGVLLPSRPPTEVHLEMKGQSRIMCGAPWVEVPTVLLTLNVLKVTCPDCRSAMEAQQLRA
jgi:hypothetical protein